MKHKLTLTVLATFMSLNAFSQVSFSHSIGASLYLNSDVSGGGIMYSPRLNFIELGDNASLSLGTHLGLGLSGSVNSREGGGGTFTIDAPVVLELNYGLAATPDEDDNFGFFAGAGFGYNAMGGADEFGGYGGSSAGPIINGGIRMLIAQRPYGLRVAYLINVKDEGASTLGIGIFYMFGDY